MYARWFTGLAIAAAITMARTDPATAQVSVPRAGGPIAVPRVGSLGVVPSFNNGVVPSFNNPAGLLGGMTVAPGPTYPSIANPQGFGLFPPSPFVPNIRAPQSIGLNPLGLTPGIADIRNPQSVGFNPLAVNPFFPNVAAPLSGTFNPAASIPMGTAAIPPTSVFPTTSVLGTTGVATPGVLLPSTTPTFVGPGGLVMGYGVGGATPVAVPVPVGVPVPMQPGSAAAARSAARPTVMREGRAIQDMQQLMARTPLTNGTVAAVGSGAIQARIRVGGKAQVRRYPLAQVFFFTASGELRNAGRSTHRLTRGEGVLVPVTPIEKVVLNR